MILGALLSTLGAMAALNVLVDPYAECGTQIFLPDDSDQHSRVMKVALLRRRDAPPQALILGNSRSLALSPTTVRALTGLRTFNAAAANANVWDVLAFTRYVLGQPKRDLRLVILGFDTFMLIGSWAPPDEQLLYFPLVRYLPEVRPPLFRAQLSRAGRLTSANTAVCDLEE